MHRDWNEMPGLLNAWVNLYVILEIILWDIRNVYLKPVRLSVAFVSIVTKKIDFNY